MRMKEGRGERRPDGYTNDFIPLSTKKEEEEEPPKRQQQQPEVG